MCHTNKKSLTADKVATKELATISIIGDIIRKPESPNTPVWVGCITINFFYDIPFTEYVVNGVIDVSDNALWSSNKALSEIIPTHQLEIADRINRKIFIPTEITNNQTVLMEFAFFMADLLAEKMQPGALNLIQLVKEFYAGEKEEVDVVMATGDLRVSKNYGDLSTVACTIASPHAHQGLSRLDSTTRGEIADKLVLIIAEILMRHNIITRHSIFTSFSTKLFELIKAKG